MADRDKVHISDGPSPIGELARKQRRWLLGSSMLAVTVCLGFRPSEIDILGVTIKDLSPGALPLMGLIVVGYFLVAFSVYSFHDLTSARMNAWWSFRDQVIKDGGQDVDEADKHEEKVVDALTHYRKRWEPIFRRHSRARSARVVFDVGLPVAVGILAFVLLLMCRAAPPTPADGSPAPTPTSVPSPETAPASSPTTDPRPSADTEPDDPA